jgi:hypothetical protein
MPVFTACRTGFFCVPVPCCAWLLAEALTNWSKLHQLWWVFEQLAARTHLGRALLCSQSAVGRLLHAFYGARSTLRTDEVGPLLPDVGSQMVTPAFGPLLSCVALLVAHASTRAVAMGVRVEAMVSDAGICGVSLL